MNILHNYANQNGGSRMIDTDWCFRELVGVGLRPENITTYDIDGSLSADEAMLFDGIYFTGGDTSHLLRCVKETGFDGIVKKTVSFPAAGGILSGLRFCGNGWEGRKNWWLWRYENICFKPENPDKEVSPAFFCVL